MKTFKTLLICTIIALGFTSCQQDDLLLEETPEGFITADVVLGNGKGTKRATTVAASRPALLMTVPTSGNNGSITQVLPSALAHNVGFVEVVLEETEGAIPLQEVYTLEKIADNGNNARFKTTGVNFQEGYIPNLALNAQLIFKDEAGQVINNDPFEAFPTAQSKNGIYLRKPQVKCELDGSCLFTIKVKGNNAAQVASLQGFVTNEAGDSQDIIFERIAGGDEEMNHTAMDNPIFQGSPGAMNNVIAQLTAYDNDGNILDSQIELVMAPEIDYGPQVGKLSLTRFGDSVFYLAQSSLKGVNRELVTEFSITFMQDFSESTFYELPVIASNENRELYWRTFGGEDFTLSQELETTIFGLALDEEENVLDIKKKKIEVQQAAVMPQYPSVLSYMENGNMQYSITFDEPQDSELITWVVFEDGSRTEKGRYRLRPEDDNPLVWTAKNIKPAANNGLEEGETVTALTCRYDRGIQAIVDGRLDGELVVPAGGTSYEIAIQQLQLSQNSGEDAFTLETEISGNDLEQISQVAVFITPQDGGSDSDPEDFVLDFAEDTVNGKLYVNDFITFSDPEAVVGMEYLIEYTITDTDGNEIAYLETTTIATESAPSQATICMDNGETPSSFNISIESNDPDVQQLDILTLQFLNNGETFSVQESYDLPRTGTNGEYAVFTLTNVEFLNLNEVNNGLMVLTSPLADLPYGSSLSFNDTPLKALDLGYYNEETGKWECEDECLEPDGNGQICGTTDHF